jgi:ATP-binding cassette subfamily F protein 3
MIKVTNVTKIYGQQTLLDSVSFNINSRERVGLVGRNGDGKSTLFRLLLHQEEVDAGEIVIPKGYAIGHLEQHLSFSQATLLEEACLGLPHDQQNDHWRVEKILFGLGFSESDLERHPQEFSGGFQIRLNLAKVLVSDPDMLLLDEPTNYLDIISIRWLIKFLNAWKKELILITHDRSFMDSVTTHTMGIHRRKMRKIQGKTDKLYAQLAVEEEVHEKTRLNDEKRRKEMEVFITRFRAKARLAGLVQSRMKTLEKSKKLDKLEKIETLDFEFNFEDFPAKVMMETHNLAFAYKDQAPLIENLNLVIHKQERIGIIGKNGKGKSTLLRLLAGELDPVHGAVKRHPKLDVAYFGQTNIQRLDPAKTIEEELMLADPAANRRKARDICGAMMFSGDLALKKVQVLSGGEKSRVLLGKLLLSPAHLLLLDEPTNHLDIDSCEALLEAINAFEGSVAIVTHDEMFLHTIPNKFVVFDRDRVYVYTGTYQEFLDEIGWESEDTDKPSARTKAEAAPTAAAAPDTAPAGSHPAQESNKDTKKAKAALVQEKSKALRPLEMRIKELEGMISRLEDEQEQNNKGMIEASMQNDVPALIELPKKNHALKQQLDFLYQELEVATQGFEKKTIEFEKRLASLL